MEFVDPQFFNPPPPLHFAGLYSLTLSLTLAYSYKGHGPGNVKLIFLELINHVVTSGTLGLLLHHDLFTKMKYPFLAW